MTELAAHVVLHTIKDYFDDLEASKSDKTVVRTEVTERKRDESGGVTDIFLVSGFCDDEHLYELTLNCGEVWMGDSDPNPKAIREAKEAYRQIEEMCQKLSIRHGGGQWQLT